MVTRVVRNSLQRPRPLLRGRFSGTLSGELIRRCHAARVPLREFLSRRIVLLAVGSVSLCRATVEKGTLLDRKRLVSDVTDDMGLGLEYHVAALDRSFYSAVYNDLLCRDASMDLSIWRNDQRSAAHITFYLTVDLNQSFRADTIFRPLPMTVLPRLNMTLSRVHRQFSTDVNSP